MFLAGILLTRLATIMHRGLGNMDYASFFSEATLIEIGVYFMVESHKCNGNIHSV